MCTRYSTREEDQNVPEYTGAHVPSPNMDVWDREKRSDSQRGFDWESWSIQYSMWKYALLSILSLHPLGIIWSFFHNKTWRFLKVSSCKKMRTWARVCDPAAGIGGDFNSSYCKCLRKWGWLLSRMDCNICLVKKYKQINKQRCYCLDCISFFVFLFIFVYFFYYYFFFKSIYFHTSAIHHVWVKPGPAIFQRIYRERHSSVIYFLPTSLFLNTTQRVWFIIQNIKTFKVYSIQ